MSASEFVRTIDVAVLESRHCVQVSHLLTRRNFVALVK